MENDLHANANGGNRDANGGHGDANRVANGIGQNRHYQRWDRLPNSRIVSFTIPEEQLEFLYETWAIAHARIRQQLYHPEQPFAPVQPPPLWREETRAMMVLWIERERRIFESEMREIEYLLGIRGAR